MAKDETGIDSLPSKLRDVVEEILDKGPIDLGGGLQLNVIGEDVSHKCKCKCTISGLISGPATILASATGNYKFKAGTIGVNGEICENCAHTSTDWTSSDPQKFPPQNPTLTTCDIKVPKGTAVGTQITLTATPKATCKCTKEDGTKATIDCTGTPDSITITTR